MDMSNDMHDTNLSDDDQKVSTEKTIIYSSSKKDNTVPDLETDMEQAITGSRMDSCREITEYIQPDFPILFDENTISESVTSGLSRFAKVLGTLAISSAKNSFTTAAERVWKSSTLYETFSPDSALPDSLQEETSDEEWTRTTIEENEICTNSIEEIACSTLESVLPSTETAVRSAKTALSILEENIKRSFDKICFADLISKTLDISHLAVMAVDRIRTIYLKVVAEMQAFYERFDYTASEWERLILQQLRNTWDRRPQLVIVPWREELKYTISLRKIIPYPPGQVREYVVRIRQCYLRRHQRIGDDSDDMDDSFLLILAA